LENSWTIIVDHVGTRELLAQLYRDYNKKSTQILDFAPGKQFFELEWASTMLLFQSNADIFDDGVDIEVIDRSIE
jgi:hypothetical protein